MGCCYSSETEATEQDRSERKPLIPHPNPDSKPPNGTERSPPGLSSTRTDEQALLTSILNKTAMSIIDVSAADSQGMEQHEYMDKSQTVQVSKIAAYAYSAISQIKVDAKEELVVQFAIP
ncbi:hypothetical protein SRHO_G00211420 [Serrasalmus rhombeus]